MPEDKSIKVPASGSATAEEIYLAVGRALSYWEAAEDAVHEIYTALYGRMATISRTVQSVPLQVFLKGNRDRRNQMLKEALRENGHRILPPQCSEVIAALSKLNALAERRSQIAHGYCISTKQTVDGEVTMAGCYLIPSLVEGVHVDRTQNELKYAHTASSINEFTEEVRDVRWQLVQVRTAIMERSNAFEHGVALDFAMLIREAVLLDNHLVTPEHFQEVMENYFASR
jgi:hypothetical protein